MLFIKFRTHYILHFIHTFCFLLFQNQISRVYHMLVSKHFTHIVLSLMICFMFLIDQVVGNKWKNHSLEKILENH